MKQTLFITGTDTGVGKTVLTTILARSLSERGINVVALKPVCSGSRDDTHALHAAMDGALTLDEINPWHFRAGIAPLLAARKENRRVKLSQVVAHILAVKKRFDVVLVESAGGLLSPLGEDFNSRDLMAALHATPVIVAPNKLGAVNQVLLTLEALPEKLRANARVVLFAQPKPDVSAKSNANLIAELSNPAIFSLPWLGKDFLASKALKGSRVQATLSALVG